MRSPLKDKPLRNPGQSLDERLIDSAFEATQYLVIAVFLIFLAGIEWWKQYASIPPAPIFYSSIALISVAYSGIKLRYFFIRAKNDKLGRDGEKCVGQFLDKLRANGAQIFHDIPAKGFNLDHVVISEKGIFVVETKTFSKPKTGSPTIEFNGETITKNGYELDRDPIKQVTAASKYLHDIISESTGRHFNIQPIVTFPGWYVKPSSKKPKSNVWVLNPKVIPTFIANANNSISNEDVQLSSYHLSRYIRTYKNVG